MSGKLTFEERARKAARAKWGPRRHVNLTELDPRVADVIRSILAAEENARRRAEDEPAAER